MSNTRDLARLTPLPTGQGIYTWNTPAAGVGLPGWLLTTTDNIPEGTANLFYTGNRTRQTTISTFTVSPSATPIVSGDQFQVALGKLQGQINATSKVVDTIAALRALLSANVTKAIVFGYYAKGDEGGGIYYFDSADTTSADNGGTIIVGTDGGRWKLVTIDSISVKQFGAKGDGSTNDTAAIQAAFAANPTGTIRFPSGVYNYTILTFDSAVGLRLLGEGALGATILRCTSTGSTNGVKLRSVFDCTVSLIHFDHSSASFTGYLVEANHKPSSSTDTQGLWFDRCTFASQGYNLYSAKGLNLDQSTLISVLGCKFLGLLRPIDGQNSAGGSYSNVVTIFKCQFYDNVGYPVNYPGQQWTVQDCNMQASHDGAARMCFSGNATPFISLKFVNCSAYDATAAGTSLFNLGAGSGLSIEGGLYGGRSDLGTSTFIATTGAITGASCRTAKPSLMTNLIVLGAAGSVGWDFAGGNDFSGVTNMLVNPGNIIGISFDLNSPPKSLGTFPTTSGGPSLRYNQDGSFEMTGFLTVTSATTTAVTFPTAYPTACWDVQPVLQSPAVVSNVASLVGVPTATGFSVYVSGTGSNVVRWRAVGR